MRAVAAFALAAVGCGRFGFSDRARTGDARADTRMVTGDGAGDAPPASADPILAMPFVNITDLTAVNDPTYNEDDPTLTGDLLEIFFDSDRPAAGAAMGDIWTATRAAVTDPFGTPTLVTELASLSDDTTPEVSADGLTMYFSSDRLTAGDRDIYVTTRPDRQSAWSTPQRVPELSHANLDDDSAEPLPDGLHLVMSIGMQPALSLYLATRATQSSSWNTPIALPGVSDPSYDESQQWASSDLTVIYFVTDKPPSASQDIWLATRPDAQSTFTISQELELSTGAQDVDPWLTPDLHTIYFASNRTNQMDIYTATR